MYYTKPFLFQKSALSFILRTSSQHYTGKKENLATKRMMVSSRRVCLEDTCRVPCSATWPCSAACTPAGCQPAGRPISGPGQSVSVRGGSAPCLTTWLGAPRVLSSPVPSRRSMPTRSQSAERRTRGSSPRLIAVLAGSALRVCGPSGGRGGAFRRLVVNSETRMWSHSARPGGAVCRTST